MYEFVFSLDRVIAQWLNSFAGQGAFPDSVIIFSATYLWYLVVAALAVLVIAALLPRYERYERRNIGLFIFAFASAVIARFVLTTAIRFLYNRPRPFEVLEGARQLVERNGGGSFPSGHASLAFAVATAVSFYYPKTGVLFFLAAILTGAGRVAAGVHWPSDILGGALVGIITAVILRTLFARYKNKNATS